uniref:D-aspartate oxidase n=1 Tax=Buteo japonicus TaxID=224669 RepID=A0A8C0HHV5_9AVES
MAAPKVAVVGAGVIGLSTALCITETCPSCSVTVLSDQFSPNTTSDVAAGMLIPHTYPGACNSQWFKETFTFLFAISNSPEASEAGIHLVSGEYNVVVNCAGIGAHQLVGDEKLFPVRGQVLKVHAPWVKNFIRDGDGSTYIYPGIHRVTLGGTREKGSWGLSPDPSTTKDIFDRCCSLEPSLRGAQDIEVKVGLRPSRRCVRLQREVLSRGGVKLPVVHNYGHGAGGFSVQRGTAKEAARLVGECILFYLLHCFYPGHLS